MKQFRNFIGHSILDYVPTQFGKDSITSQYLSGPLNDCQTLWQAVTRTRYPVVIATFDDPMTACEYAHVIHLASARTRPKTGEAHDLCYLIRDEDNPAQEGILRLAKLFPDAWLVGVHGGASRGFGSLDDFLELVKEPFEYLLEKPMQEAHGGTSYTLKGGKFGSIKDVVYEGAGGILVTALTLLEHPENFLQALATPAFKNLGNLEKLFARVD